MLFIQHRGYLRDDRRLSIDDFGKHRKTMEMIGNILTVEMVTADRDEAEYIRQRFTSIEQRVTIPWNYRSSNQTQAWFGDIARTILSSLI